MLGPLAPVWLFRLVGLALLLPFARPLCGSRPVCVLVGILAGVALDTLPWSR